MNIIRWPYAHQGGGVKMQNGRFPCKIALHLKNVCYKVFSVNTVNDNVERHSLANLHVQNGSHGTSPTTWKFGRNWLTPSGNADFPSIFARSASAVTPSENSSVNTNRKFIITSFPVSLRWIVYVAPKLLTGGSKCKVSKIWTTFCDNFENFVTVRDRMSVSFSHW